MGGRVFPAVNVWGLGCGAGLTLKRCNHFDALREEEREGGTIAESLVGRARVPWHVIINSTGAVDLLIVSY